MATHARGLICLCLTEERCDELGLRADDRARTRRRSAPPSPSRSRRARASRPASPPPTARTRSRSRSTRRQSPHDLVQPGHVFPLRARAGGVLERAGQTEAAVDLARLAGLNPAGVVCEIMNEDGTMARVPDLDPVLRAARAQDDHGRRPDRVPAPARRSSSSASRRCGCRPSTASSPRSPSARR